VVLESIDSINEMQSTSVPTKHKMIDDSMVAKTIWQAGDTSLGKIVEARSKSRARPTTAQIEKKNRAQFKQVSGKFDRI